jgi:hypothetical protein
MIIIQLIQFATPSLLLSAIAASPRETWVLDHSEIEK